MDLEYSTVKIKDASEIRIPFLYTKFLEIAKKLRFDLQLITAVHAVHNRQLLDAFNTWRTAMFLKHRNSPEKFKNTRDWQAFPDGKQKAAFADGFSAYCSQFFWNKANTLNAIPMLQGTHGENLADICQQGFGNSSTTDDGYYGRGMYFTSSLDYAAKYANKSSNKGKAIIVSMVTPGNVFPVTEHPNDTIKGYKGKACRPGYQSHFTLVNKSNIAGAFPVTGDIDPSTTADELVVFESAQTVPIFYFYTK